MHPLRQPDSDSGPGSEDDTVENDALERDAIENHPSDHESTRDTRTLRDLWPDRAGELWLDDEDDVQDNGDEDDDEDEDDDAWWLPAFHPQLSLIDNVWMMTRPLWGAGIADWAAELATRVGRRFPDSLKGRRKRGWTAAVLHAAARAALFEQGGAPGTGPVPEALIADIVERTGMTRENFDRYLKRLDEAELVS